MTQQPKGQGRIKQYFSRHGEHISDWIEHANKGKVIILPHLADAKDSVLTLGLEAIEDSNVFDIVDLQPHTVPLDGAEEPGDKLDHHFEEAFREPLTSELRVLRIPIFRVPLNVDGQPPECFHDFVSKLSKKLENVGTTLYSSFEMGNTTFMPIVDITTKGFGIRLQTKLQRALKANTPTEDSKVVVFDTRAFEATYLNKMLAPEFPDEVIENNPDFERLLTEDGGEARLSFLIRSYKRKGTIELFGTNADGSPVSPTFSSLYDFVKSQELHAAVIAPPTQRAPSPPVIR